MSGSHKPSDDPHGPAADPLANEIGRAFAAPALPADLQQRLGQELDAAFASANDPILAARSGSLARLVQKKYEVIGDDVPAAVERGEISRLRYELHDLAAPAEKRMGIGRQIALASAAAAVLLACVWSQPGYRWSEVVESVRQQPMVQIEVEGEPVESPQLVATRRDQTGKRRPTTASYLNMSGEILRRVSGDNGAGSRLLPTARRAELVESDLVAALLELAGAESNQEVYHPRVSVSQSWPRSTAQGVALDLVIRRGEQRVDATLLLAPSTKLPINCVLRSGDAPAKQLRFRYSADEIAK